MDDYPLLDQKSSGHLRHVLRLADQLPGEWAHMGGREPDQEGDDAYRYQLAFMSYMLALPTYHYTPNYREVNERASERLIQKMLRRDVWGYWEQSSRGSKYRDPDLTAPGEGWIDPVKNKNIMYSGHLLTMVGLHSMLYGDKQYNQPGSLTFVYDPVFRGLGETLKFQYDYTSLAETIYDQLKKSDWVGIQCEINSAFIICNQFALLGLRLHDVVNGSRVSDEAFEKYKAEWTRRGWFTADGNLRYGYLERQAKVIDHPSPYIDGWASCFPHAWYPELVEGAYPKQAAKWIKYSSDASVASVSLGDQTESISTSDFGHMAILASEVGDLKAKSALLAYAGRYLSPVWDDGAYFYPRQDQLHDESGNVTYVNRITGNALYAVARINTRDGIRKMMMEPFTPGRLEEPFVTGVDRDAADVARAVYDRKKNALIVTLRSLPGQESAMSFGVRNLPRASHYSVHLDGKVVGEVRNGKVSSEPGGVELNWDDQQQLLSVSALPGGERTVVIRHVEESTVAQN